MLGRRRRRRTKFKPTLAQYLAFARFFPNSSSALCVTQMSGTHSTLVACGRYNHMLSLLLLQSKIKVAIQKWQKETHIVFDGQ